MAVGEPDYIDQQRIAAEVLELGEALVDSLIDAATNREGDTCSLEEWRDATDQFFFALRLLLANRLEGPSE